MKKGLSLLLVLTMLLTCATAGAETVKHERVFAVLSADGTPVTILDNVRLENGDGLDEIEDRTILSEIQNVSGAEPFTRSEEQITWKAAGNDITYRGKSKKTLPAMPIVAYELDGEVIDAKNVAEAVGTLRLTVTYAQERALPLLALTVVPVPKGVTEISAEHAALVSEGDKRFVVGWGVPGADAALALPASFTVTCRVDHADFKQMLTVETAAPLLKLLEEGGETIDDADRLVGDLTAILSAMQAGQPLPETSGDLNELTQTLTALMNGVTQLDEGAVKLLDGTDALESGATTLHDGLSTLINNNAPLIAGAQQIYAAILQTANTQLASAGLDALGIVLPELTAENYAATLDAAIAQLADADALKSMIAQSARAQVAAAVEENDASIRAAVAQAVQAQVLQAVLSKLKMPVTAADYAAAVEAKQVTKDQDAQIQAAVAMQMQDKGVLEKMEAAVAEQKEALIAQNMESAEVQTQMAGALSAAQAGMQKLAELQANLDGVNAFVAGLTTYTDGVSRAAEGAAQLMTGSTSLKDGALALQDGTETLHTGLVNGEKKLADQLLPYLVEDGTKMLGAIHAMADTLDGSLCYDMVAEGMGHDLSVFIRTEMNR